MATQFSMTDIMNAALLEEGFEEISANDGSDEFRLLSRVWPAIVEAEMEVGALNFTRFQTFVNASDTGWFGYSTAYLIPGDALHVRSVWVLASDGVTRTGPAWAQDGIYVYTDETAGIYMEYLVAADPAFWSANFSVGVQKKLQASLLNFREDRSAAMAMDQQAEVYFQRARTASSQARSKAPGYVRGRIAKARHNG